MSRRDECFYIGDAQTPEEILSDHYKRENTKMLQDEEIIKQTQAEYARNLLYVQSVDDFADMIDKICELKGWNNDNRSMDAWIALAHSEISEAYEEYRNHRGPTEIYYNEDNPTKPEGIPIELADAVIRIMHYFAHHKISLREALIMKLSYNITRPYRHGGKKA